MSTRRALVSDESLKLTAGLLSAALPRRIVIIGRNLALRYVATGFSFRG